MAKKKALSKVAEPKVTAPPITDDVKKAIALMDPNGRRRVATGIQAEFQEALEILYGIVEKAEA